MTHICEFCHNTFSSSSNLALHQKSAKYCLKLRGSSLPKIKYECKYCKEIFNRQSSLFRHDEVCPKSSDYWKEVSEKKEAENIALKEKIRELELQLAQKEGMLMIKTAPKTINNNTNFVSQKLLTIQCDTIDPLTVDTVKKAIDSGGYTFQHFKLGADGIVDFISDIICTEDGQRNYACSDISRNKCHRLIETRDWQTDNGATFINKILDQLREPAIRYNAKIIEMWEKSDERELGDELREKTRDTFKGIVSPKTLERKELFAKVRTEVKKLAAV